MQKNKRWERHSPESLAQGLHGDPRGRLFGGPELVDLSRVAILASTLDTVRQLYRGTIQPQFLQALETALTTEGKKETVITGPMGLQWAIGRLGKAAGYQFRLQNNEAGFVILCKSWYREADQEGPHLKIEVSPHAITALGLEGVQSWADDIAQTILKKYAPSGVAVHLAVDIQGWELPPLSDWEPRFVTRSRRSSTVNGIDDGTLDLREVAVTYGQTQTRMYGNASGAQFILYRKDLEAKKRDKEDYYHQHWHGYNVHLPVYRAELRLHHQVTQEIGHHLDESFTSLLDVRDYLGDFWRYGLDLFRLGRSKGSAYIDPFWQLLQEDADFHQTGCWIKRKKKDSLGETGRNIAAMIGNLVTLMARQGANASKLMKQLKQLDIWPQIELYYRTRGISISELRQALEQQLALRRLIGQAA